MINFSNKKKQRKISIIIATVVVLAMVIGLLVSYI